MATALSGLWIPPSGVEEDRSERQTLAAARLFFYGYQARDRWFNATSGEARRELLARDGVDWTLSFIYDIDGDCEQRGRKASDGPVRPQHRPDSQAR